MRLAEYDIAILAISFRTRGKRPSRDYVSELEDLRWARDELRAKHDKVALVGRSFGGRMCAFLAAVEPPDALAILGHPISPPDRPRPADEDALQGMRCPTLIVQGDRDELGPLSVLQRMAVVNPLIDLAVIEGAGHDFGAKESEAAEQVARWLDATLR
jgi:predicted alpha/beta-hydrolase family hydrolase